MQQARKYFGNTTETLLLISLLYTAAVMPFQKQGVPVWPGIALMAAVWLFSGNLKTKFQLFLAKRNALIFSSLYLFYCLGLFYSSNTDYAQTDLLLKIPLLLFPLVISSSSLKGKTDFILKIFLLAALLSAVICVARSGYLTYTTGENYFYYYKLSWFFHVGHYTMYLVFAAFVALYFFFKEEKSNIKAVYIFTFLFLTLVIFLLSARAQIIAYFAVITCGAIFYLLKNGNRLKGLLILFLLLTTAGVALYFIPATRERFKTTEVELNHFFNGNKPNSYASYLRLAVWQTGVEVIREHPLTGTGTGDAKDELIKKAQEKNYDIIVKKNLNYHNQFMQTWAAIGLPGFFALLFSIITGIVYSLNKRQYLVTAFFMIIVISFLTESMLERQAGVIFYSFFSAILIFADNE